MGFERRIRGRSDGTENVLGGLGEPAPRVEQVGLATPRARDRKVAEPSPEPRRRRRWLEHLTGVDRLIEGVDEISKLGSINDSSALVRVDHGDAAMRLVPNRDEEASRYVHAEDIQPDSFRRTAIGEGAGDG